ncbi:MAG TPA: putative glycoside hydrolase, partial [Solirubrobacteraceae bacterium]|nr:putative glycoside hydrolase [Solirubrobacteraceae bacterium]
MRTGLRRAFGIAALTLTMIVTAAASAAADTAGTIHFVRSADSSFDSVTSSPSPQTQAWLREHVWRMLAWSPYFDEKTAWYPQAWMYDDSYAIYRESSLAAQHPEWILHDSAGNKLYIPFECSGGTCPQYAADISNPAFRHYWIEQAKSHYAHGYRGLFVDDVNMEERVGNAAEALVAPVGVAGAISGGAWREYMADFMTEIRTALPGAEIVHNAIWFANGNAGIGDPSIRREVEAANYVMLERGVNDSGITGGSGQWSLNALLGFIDGVHSLGRGIVLDGAASEPQGMEYNLAAYF